MVPTFNVIYQILTGILFDFEAGIELFCLLMIFFRYVYIYALYLWAGILKVIVIRKL